MITEIIKIREKNTNLLSLVYWLGYPCVMIPYTRARHRKGESRWTYSKKVKLFIDSFVAFSYFPIRLLSAMGILFSLAVAIYLCIVTFSYFTHRIPVSGWTSLVILVTFNSGLQLTMLGVLSEYLWRNYDESRRRPTYIVNSIHRS